MIVFDLKCTEHHQFEVWFRSSADFEDQKGRGLLECPYCGDKQITKALMAPNVAAKSNQRRGDAPPPMSAVNTGGQNSPVTVKPAALSGTDKGTGHQTALADTDIPAPVQEAFQEAVKKINSHVEKNFDHVGKGFAEEARRIHYGETKNRAIYGEATKEETAELIEEGVDVLPLPGVMKKDA